MKQIICNKHTNKLAKESLDLKFKEIGLQFEVLFEKGRKEGWIPQDEKNVEKYFIITESGQRYIDYIERKGLDPLKVFQCQTKEQAIKDYHSNINAGYKPEEIKVIKLNY